MSSMLLPALGGALIGLSSTWLMLTIGRVAGISGIIAMAHPLRTDGQWRVTFLVGLVLGGLVLGAVAPSTLSGAELQAPTGLVILAGLLVGFGTRLGSGCTSGHGVCGISRLSVRSIVATLTFIGAGAVTLVVFRHLLGVI